MCRHWPERGKKKSVLLCDSDSHPTPHQNWMGTCGSASVWNGHDAFWLTINESLRAGEHWRPHLNVNMSLCGLRESNKFLMRALFNIDSFIYLYVSRECLLFLADIFFLPVFTSMNIHIHVERVRPLVDQSISWLTENYSTTILIIWSAV